MYRHEQSLSGQPWGYNDHARRYFVAKIRYVAREIPLKSQTSLLHAFPFLLRALWAFAWKNHSFDYFLLSSFTHNVQIEVKNFLQFFTMFTSLRKSQFSAHFSSPFFIMEDRCVLIIFSTILFMTDAILSFIISSVNRIYCVEYNVFTIIILYV